LLAVTSYPQDHVDRCREAFEAQVAAYRALSESVGKGKAAPALAGFAPLFFANLVLALDEWFVHRSRTVEGKNGGPLNEVRLVCEALVSHDGILTGQRSIRYDADASVLGIPLGEQVVVTEDGFVALLDAGLAESEVRFAP
jgi:hypothetical protein